MSYFKKMESIIQTGIDVGVYHDYMDFGKRKAVGVPLLLGRWHSDSAFKIFIKKQKENKKEKRKKT